MITQKDYYKTVEDLQTPENEKVSAVLLERVNALLDYLLKYHGIPRKINPRTGSEISGNGSGGGGARRKDSKEGRALSSHKEFKGIDITDPDNSKDAVITDAMLLKFDLYRESPEYTKNWVHLTYRAPRSGKRSFIP